MSYKPFFLAFVSVVFAITSWGQATRLIVAQDGSGNFRTVQEALNAIPKNNNKPFTVFIKNGIYKEKVYLDSSRRFVTRSWVFPPVANWLLY